MYSFKALTVSMPALVCVVMCAVACGDTKKATTTTPPPATCTAPMASDFPANNPNTCSNQMFAKYQIGAFGKVNGDIIAKAADPATVPNVGDSFQTRVVQKGTARINSFTSNLAAFLITHYGNPSDPNYVAYTGPAMDTIHAGLNITTAQYNYFISSVVVPVLTADGVSASDIANCFAPVVLDPALMKQIITCH